MGSEAKRYLDLIGAHLRERHASVLVGAGFSRNAVKIDDSLGDSPDWAQLGEIFLDRLTDEPKQRELLRRRGPLVLAEQVEAIYGRLELDHLLLSHIRDGDFLPSSLHRKLLELPWSDIFTTNYDTLLERASKELEQELPVITCKEDLIGSSGTTRIIKLHGSFPSHRPFIISSEDYRTYPQKFAPFVNTVQQSMLENTLCLIGFSGDDPNFEKWTGWIRDNLGSENTPNIYLLLHYTPSEAEKKLLDRKRIVPVDLSQLTSNSNITAIYDAALDYLLELQKDTAPDEWDLNGSFQKLTMPSCTFQTALEALKAIHTSYPGWLTVPNRYMELLRSTANEAISRLGRYTREDSVYPDQELEYLCEYDWLREKTLLPPFASELECYHKILVRHPETSPQKSAVQLSLLRGLRESGDWAEWDGLHQELEKENSALTAEQLHQLRWEECLYAQARYQYQELKQKLTSWNVGSETPVWVLRKAGILAEYGECKQAHTLLRQGISDIRHRLTHQRRVDLYLLSLESAMMFLLEYIGQSINVRTRHSKTDVPADDGALVRRRRALHDQYHVDWETQNNKLSTPLEAAWVPYRTEREQASFDFGRMRKSSFFGADKEVINAYTFLRFREESGIPFYISGCYDDKKAACGAAERIARYSPFLSILTVVRADEPKTLEQVITRGILSSWTQPEADETCQFYLNALVNTESELSADDWFYREHLAQLAADVLPELLSELCVKCSYPQLHQLLLVVKQLYASPKKQSYSHILSLSRRLIAAWPSEHRQELVLQLLSMPLPKSDRDERDFPDLLSFVPSTRIEAGQTAQSALPEIDALLEQYRSAENQRFILDRLLHCSYQGLLIRTQGTALRDLLWTDGDFHVPKGWLRTVCLDLPAPAGVDVQKYLAKTLVENICNNQGDSIDFYKDFNCLREVRRLILTTPHSFSDEQISNLLAAFDSRLIGLSKYVLEGRDFLGTHSTACDEMYETAHTLWLLTGNGPWTSSGSDLQHMKSILETYKTTGIRHCGLYCAWEKQLGNEVDLTRELAYCFQTGDKTCARWGFETLAIGILHPQMGLMEDPVIQSSMDILAQQIIWGVPRQLTLALEAVKIVVLHKPELISDNALSAILTGLSQLQQQTTIDIEDTAASASEKGSIRTNAAALAKAMYGVKLFGAKPEVLEQWLAIMNDPNEFVEIRMAE